MILTASLLPAGYREAQQRLELPPCDNPSLTLSLFLHTRSSQLAEFMYDQARTRAVGMRPFPDTSSFGHDKDDLALLLDRVPTSSD